MISIQKELYLTPDDIFVTIRSVIESGLNAIEESTLPKNTNAHKNFKKGVFKDRVEEIGELIFLYENQDKIF